MEAREYDILAAIELRHWWFRGLHRILVDALRRLGIGPGSLVLDAGCGTGGLALRLGEELGCRPVGFDRSALAAARWPGRRLDRACLATVNDIPFAAGVFDAVICVDVIESEGVDPTRALGEMFRVTRPGGVLVLVVPAYRWMTGDDHHRAVHAVRRFGRCEARVLVTTAGFALVRTSHVFALLFAPIALWRLLGLLKQRPTPARDASRSDLSLPPSWLNALLLALVRLEGRLLGHIDMPFGTSLLLVARKPGGR